MATAHEQHYDEDRRRWADSSAWEESEGFKGPCGLCGEEIDFSSPLPSKSDAGEFYNPNNHDFDEVAIAHAQCGIDAGWKMA